MRTDDGFVLWLLGPTSSGKTTLAKHFLKQMREKGMPMIHYDGDEVRDFFGPEFDFSQENRLRVVKTLVHLSNKASETGLNVVVSALTANPDARKYVKEHTRNIITGSVRCSIDVCAGRDPKGLYKRAQQGEITTLIGHNSEYVEPENPDIVLDTEKYSPEELVGQIFVHLYSAKSNSGSRRDNYV